MHYIDYCGIDADPDFHLFLDSLAQANESGLSQDEFHALYMNAYNALAIKTVIQHSKDAKSGHCIKSIKDIPDVSNQTVWNQKVGVLAGKEVALNEVEGMLRDPSPFGFSKIAESMGVLFVQV